MITWVAPTSTASTTRAAGLKAKRDGGLPPLELASPAGPTSPECIRASMRDATVDRASPVVRASSARVRALPSRRSWNRSPARDRLPVASEAAGSGPAGVLMSQ